MSEKKINSAGLRNSDIKVLMGLNLWDGVLDLFWNPWYALKRHLSDISQVIIVPFIVVSITIYLFTLDNIILDIFSVTASIVSYFFAAVMLLRVTYMATVDGEVDMAAAKKNLFITTVKYIAGAILYNLITFGGFLLLIIPGVIFSANYLLVPYLIIIDGKGVLESFGLSKKMMVGRRFNVFVLLFAVTGLWILLMYLLIAIGGILALFFSYADAAMAGIVLFYFLYFISVSVISVTISGAMTMLYANLKK